MFVWKHEKIKNNSPRVVRRLHAQKKKNYDTFLNNVIFDLLSKVISQQMDDIFKIFDDISIFLFWSQHFTGFRVHEATTRIQLRFLQMEYRSIPGVSHLGVSYRIGVKLPGTWTEYP